MRIFLLVLALVLWNAAPATAQKLIDGRPSTAVERFNYFDFSRTYLADPKYRYMARRALNERPPKFDFGEFRLRYMQSTWYDPLAEDTEKALLALADQARNAQEAGEREELYGRFRGLAHNHLANLGVMITLADLAKEDKNFGDEETYRWLLDGLMRDILASGDGKSRDTAYDVITFTEETQLLAHLDVEPLSVEYERRGLREHNRHLVRDNKTGLERELYVSVRFPMSKLRYEQKIIERNKDPLARR